MTQLLVKVRTARITSRAALYRTLILMAGRHTLWPSLISGFLIAVITLGLAIVISSPTTTTPQSTSPDTHSPAGEAPEDTTLNTAAGNQLGSCTPANDLR